jgi:hypothetical protein
MKWEVQISGDATDLKELAKSLKDDVLRIVERNNQYFLESIRFDLFTRSEEVNSATVEILSVLTGAVRLALGGRTPIRIANIAKVRDDGGRDIFVTVSDTIHVRDMVSLEIKRSDGTVEVINPADKVPDWINLALKNQKVTKTLRLLGTEEQTWVSLYRLYEVIEGDVGSLDELADKGWATKSAIRWFKHTANSPSVVGDASRHGKESTTPPVNPMDLGEARALIELILHNWLRSKL